jgi:hypothetical protein
MVEMLVALFRVTTPMFPSSPGMTELHLHWPPSCPRGHLTVTVKSKPFNLPQILHWNITHLTFF